MISFLFVLFFVPDPIAEEKDHTVSQTVFQKFHTMRSETMVLKKNYWILMGITFIFMLSRYGEAPLILNALETMGLPERFAPAIMICYNAVNSFVSYPIGFLSDRIGREKVLMMGMGCAIIANVLIAKASSMFLMFIGVAFWGAQMSITLTMFIALIADYSPMNVRGTALGIFYFISFVAVLLGSQIYAFCIENFGTLSSPFIAGILFSGIALLLTMIFLKSIQEKVID